MISYRVLTSDEFDVIRPLWERLNQYHAALPSPFAPEIASRTFETRLKALRHKAGSGSLRIEIASPAMDQPPIGYCITSLSPDGVGEVDSLYVDQANRRLGIASTLMRSALEWLRGSGAISERVVVLCENDEAVAFYRRFGFHPRNIELERRSKAGSE